MIVKTIKRFVNYLLKRRNPQKYWEGMGVTFKGKATLIQGCDFGTEPYLVEIGNHVRINNGVRFVTHDGGVWVVRRISPEYKDVDLVGRIRVGDNVHIGTEAMIMPGVSIGNNCIVGCGAIVTHSVPDNSVVAGVPARVIESVDEYITKHSKDFIHSKNLDPKEKEAYLIDCFKDYEYRR